MPAWLQILLGVLSTIISAIAIIFSYRTFILNKPKIKIVQLEKSQSYFGVWHKVDDEKVKAMNCIAHINFVLANTSPKNIEIFDVELIYNKEIFYLVNPKNDFWESVVFAPNGDIEGWDGSHQTYTEEGLIIPQVLDAYKTLKCFCLFHDFPINSPEKVTAHLIVKTTAGTMRKKIALHRFNDKHIEETVMKDIHRYERSR